MGGSPRPGSEWPSARSQGLGCSHTGAPSRGADLLKTPQGSSIKLASLPLCPLLHPLTFTPLFRPQKVSPYSRQVSLGR